MLHRHVAISGDPGSGKSTVAAALARLTGLRLVSAGQVQRDIASARGVSTLQANLDANSDISIDERIDGMLRTEGEQGPPAIFDSRLAWHFVPSALKVHIVASPDVSAERIYRRVPSAAEQYESVEAAKSATQARAESEQVRFRSKYGVNIFRLNNYDLVIDSSDAKPDDIVDIIRDALTRPIVHWLWISPRRVIPTGDAARQLTFEESFEQSLSMNEVSNDVTASIVCYSWPYFFAVRGYHELSKAIEGNRTLAPAELEAEGEEPVVGNLSAIEYLRSETRRSWIYDWEDAHGFKFDHYPPFITLESR